MNSPRLDTERATADLRFCREQFESIRSDVEDLSSALSRAQIAWQPDGSTWSVAQCIEHLNGTMEAELDRIRLLNSLARASLVMKLPRYRRARLGPIVHLHEAPRPSLAAISAARAEPPPADPDLVFERFLDDNQKLLVVIDEATTLASSESGSSTAALLLDMVGHALQLNALHHWHFVLQARRLMERPGFPRH